LPQVSSSAERSQVHSLHGDFYRAEGKLSKALESYAIASRITPEEARYKFAAAQVYEQLSNPTEALKYVREGTRLEGKSRPYLDEWVARLEAKKVELEKLREQQVRTPADALSPLLHETGEP
jgi:tetratricopeptide (TPR) repeat protein